MPHVYGILDFEDWGEVSIPIFKGHYMDEIAVVEFKYNPLYAWGTPADVIVKVIDGDKSLNGNYTGDDFDEQRDVLCKLYGNKKGLEIIQEANRLLDSPVIYKTINNFIKTYFDEDGNSLLDEDGFLIN